MHGQVEGLARIATLVERARGASDYPVIYVDAGDVEETTTRISNLTKGTAMHRLLGHAGCEAAVVGNAAWLRYGPQVVREHAAAAPYPLLCANLRPLPGARPTALLREVGFVGVTAPFADFLDSFDFGIEALDPVEVVRRHARRLRGRGAEVVVVLSHLGLDVPQAAVDDHRLAASLQGEVDLIVGAHSHDLLPEGEQVGDVLVVQAGSHAEHLGRVEIGPDGSRAEVLPVAEDTPLHPAVVAEAGAIEPEVAAFLDEVIGELPGPLDQVEAAAWLAETLRARMGAEVAIVTPGQAFSDGLPGGPLRRGHLWSVCDSSANPGVVEMKGAQLRAVIERGRDPEFASMTAGPLRGRPRGVLQVVGPPAIESRRRYAVAGTDWELEPYGGLVEPEWGLRPRYDFPTIVREAIEEHLRAS